MKIQTTMLAAQKHLTSAFRSFVGKMRNIKPILSRCGHFLRAHRESLAYYAVLTIVLTALGTAAQAYRNRGVQPETVPTPLPEAADVAAQAIPDPTQPPQENQNIFVPPVQGDIVSSFSPEELVWSETLKLWQTHPAVDLSAQEGEAVTAAADGTILEAFNDALYGCVIVIDHGEGRTLRYASLSTLQLVEVGQQVRQGDIISAAGSCPAEAELGAHVHLEYFEGGVPSDFTGKLSRD